MNRFLAQQQEGAKSKKYIFAFLVIALLGCVDAIYLTITHYQTAALSCSVSGGCETVLSSSYSMIGPVPLALLGVLYYLTILTVGILYYRDRTHAGKRMLATRLPLLGFAASVIFIFIMVFIIHGFCLYCTGSALSSTVLAALTFYI